MYYLISSIGRNIVLFFILSYKKLFFNFSKPKLEEIIKEISTGLFPHLNPTDLDIFCKNLLTNNENLEIFKVFIEN